MKAIPYHGISRSLLRLWCALTVVMLVFSAVSTRGAAYDLPDQDAFVIGRGMAFVATADNPAALYYNPAGITQLKGNNIRGGIYGLYFAPTYKNSSGSEYDNDQPWHAIPQLYYTYTPEEMPLAFGLGLYSPFGLSSEWPQGTGFRSIGTEGKLTYLTVNPAVAWKVLPCLSVAGGITLNYSEIDLRQGLSPVPNSDEFKLRADAVDVGFNLGLLWRITEQFQFGATYRSCTKMGYKGHTHTETSGMTFDSPASGDLPFPQKIIVGLSYRPTPKWNIEFDIDWTDWDAVNTVMIRQSTVVIPTDVPLVLNWESSRYYEFGVTRYLDNDWHVSFGYIYNENSVPDRNYNPVVADLDRHFLSVGAGCRLKQFDFDVSYQFGFAETRTVSGSAVSAAGQSADGQYGFNSHAIAVSVGYHF